MITLFATPVIYLWLEWFEQKRYYVAHRLPLDD